MVIGVSTGSLVVVAVRVFDRCQPRAWQHCRIHKLGCAVAGPVGAVIG